MDVFTKQGVRNLDRLGDSKPDVSLQLTAHVCRQWRWFYPPKGASKKILAEDENPPEEAAPEVRCVLCRKLWHGDEKPEAPRVESLAKVAPGLNKKKEKPAKKTGLVNPSLKAPLVDGGRTR